MPISLVTMPKPVAEVVTRPLEVERAQPDFDACRFAKWGACNDMMGSMGW